MANYSERVANAPRDGRDLILLVCTDDEEAPIAIELGYWDEELKRFDGDWRYLPESKGGYARSEPIGYREVPPIDQEFFDLITPKKPVLRVFASAGPQKPKPTKATPKVPAPKPAPKAPEVPKPAATGIPAKVTKKKAMAGV
jgi:hypothetical protein